MNWVEAKDALLSFLAAGGVYWWGAELRKIRGSVESLNITMASLLEKTMHHERQLEKIDVRLVAVEKR